MIYERTYREPDHSQIDGCSHEIDGYKDDKGHPRDGEIEQPIGELNMAGSG